VLGTRIFQRLSHESGHYWWLWISWLASVQEMLGVCWLMLVGRRGFHILHLRPSFASHQKAMSHVRSPHCFFGGPFSLHFSESLSVGKGLEAIIGIYFYGPFMAIDGIMIIP